MSVPKNSARPLIEYMRAHLPMSLLLLTACGDVVADATFTKTFSLVDVTPRIVHSAGGEHVTITGRKLCPDLRVRFDEVEATKVEVLVPEVAVVTVPPHAVGAARVSLECAEGTIVDDRPFRFAASLVRLDAQLDWPELGHLRPWGPATDVDGDGLGDLVGTSESTERGAVEVRLEVHRNTGKNGFEPEASLVFPLPPGAFLQLPLPFFAGDFTGEGTRDLAAFAWDGLEDRGRVTVTVWTGESGFTSSYTHELTSELGWMFVFAAGDFDGDGMVDLLAGDRETSTDHLRLLFLRGLGASGLGSPQLIRDVPSLGFVEGGSGALDLLGPLTGLEERPEHDLDGDGLADAISKVATSSSTTELWFFHGVARARPEILAAPANVYDDLAYVDEDALPDLVRFTQQGRSAPIMSVYFAEGIGRFGERQRKTCSGDCGYTSFGLFGRGADYDGDGVHELAATSDGRVVLIEVGLGYRVTDLGPAPSPYGEIEMMRGAAPTLVSRSAEGLPFALYPDGLAAAPEPSPKLAWAGLPMLGPAGPWKCIGDFTGRGEVDVLYAVLDPGGSTMKLAVLSARADGSFDAPKVLELPTSFPAFAVHEAVSGEACITADFDGDGRLDALPFVEDRPTMLYLSKGAEGFERVPIDLDRIDGLTARFFTHDLDGDGKSELLAISEQTSIDPSVVREDLVYVFELDREGSRLRQRFALGTDVGIGGEIADLDGDGRLEAAVLAEHDGALVLEVHALDPSRPTEGEWIPTEVRSSVALPGLGWAAIRSKLQRADLDGDGDDDLAIFGGETTVLTNDGQGRFEVTGHVFDQNATNVAGACDLDLDGRADLLYAAPHLVGFALAGPSGLAAEGLRWIDVEPVSPALAGGTEQRLDFVCRDLDHDGLPEVFVMEPGLQQLHVLYNRSR